jgi:hypothetical protein
MPRFEMGEEAQLAASLKPIAGLQGFLAELGPGLITGAADDDPSGISRSRFGNLDDMKLFSRRILLLASRLLVINSWVNTNAFIRTSDPNGPYPRSMSALA